MHLPVFFFGLVHDRMFSGHFAGCFFFLKRFNADSLNLKMFFVLKAPVGALLARNIFFDCMEN